MVASFPRSSSSSRLRPPRRWRAISSRNSGLPPLSPPAATALLTEQTGADLPEDTIDRAWAASGGNPLFLEEIARHLRGGRSLEELDERGNEATILLSRIAGPGADLRYAHAASVFGVEFRPVLAARVA